MRNILMLALSIAMLNSCKKENDAATGSTFKGLWEYQRFMGYPFNSTPLPAGNGNIILIGADGDFERRNHDTVVFRGNYTLEEHKDCFGDSVQTFFKSTEPNSGENTITISRDTLFLGTPNCLADGGTSIYVRINQD